MEGDATATLLLLVNQLQARFGCGGEERGRLPAPVELDPSLKTLEPEKELLRHSVMGCLADLVAAAEHRNPDAEPEAASAALRAVEQVMLGELRNGNADRVAELLPGFVFLVILPVLGQEEALDLSRRASGLVDELVGD